MANLHMSYRLLRPNDMMVVRFKSIFIMFI